ncbi:hypothetical protein JCM11641_006503 [Rhodosporidiobolus odoratus]
MQVQTLSTPANASIGDRSDAYHRCLTACDATLCTPSSTFASSDFPSPLFTSFPSSSLLWGCPATCSYACSSHLTDLALSLSPASPSVPSSLQGLPPGRQVQFHGKWPFHRLDLTSTFPFSIPPLRWAVYLIPAAQEPLSVLFSLGNLWAHWVGLTALRRLASSGRMAEGRTLAICYAAYAVSGVAAWVASTLFHTRDVDWTERADYFGAAGTMVVGLWSGVVRVQGWYAPLGRGKALSSPSSQRRVALAFTLACALVYLLHVAYLASLPRFNYSYNMRFNVLIALSTILLWSAWSVRQARLPSPSNFSRRQLSSYPSARARFRAPHYLTPLFPLIALPTLTALELLDFPPVSLGLGSLRLLDAHALWHLSTIPVVMAWYQFLIADVRWIDGQGEGGDPSSVLPGNSASGTTSSTSSLLAAAGGAGDGSARGLGQLLSGAALAKRRMTGLGAGLGLGIFGGWDSRRGSAVAPPSFAGGVTGGAGSSEGDSAQARTTEANGEKGSRGD